MATKASKRRVYHVVHDKSSERWRIEREGAERATRRVDTKSEAISVARRLAEGGELGLGQVIVHRADGSIEKEYTYGNDPRRTPG